MTSLMQEAVVRGYFAGMGNSMIIVVFGLPGSGKSYLAAELAGRLQAIHLSTDAIRRKIMEDTDYSPDEKQAVYDEMFRLTQEALWEGDDVVLDGTFYTAALREPFMRLRQEGHLVYFIEMRADDILIARRLAAPRADSAADLDVYRAIAADWEPLEEAHLILESTDDNLAELLRDALHFVHIHYEA